MYVDYKTGDALHSAGAPCYVTDSQVKGIRVGLTGEPGVDVKDVLYKPDVDLTDLCLHDFKTVADYENGWVIDVSNDVNVTVAANKAIEVTYDPTILDQPGYSWATCWSLQVNDITTAPVDVKVTLTEPMADGTTKEFVAHTAVSVIPAKTILFADNGSLEYVDGDVITLLQGGKGTYISVNVRYKPDNVAYENIDRYLGLSEVSAESSDTSKLTVEPDDTIFASYILKGLQISSDAVITVKCGTVSMKLTGNVVSSI